MRKRHGPVTTCGDTQEARQDLVEFLKCRCILDATASVGSTDLYAKYVSWSTMKGKDHWTQNRFVRRLKTYYDVESHRTRECNYLLGIRLAALDEARQKIRPIEQGARVLTTEGRICRLERLLSELDFRLEALEIRVIEGPVR